MKIYVYLEPDGYDSMNTVTAAFTDRTLAEQFLSQQDCGSLSIVELTTTLDDVHPEELSIHCSQQFNTAPEVVAWVAEAKFKPTATW